MGIFDFLRRKKEKPVEQKKETPEMKTSEKPLEQKRELPLQQRQKQVEQKTAQQPLRTNTQRPPQRKQEYAAATKPGVSIPTAQSQGRNYTVKSGDSLSRIAKQFYGTANDWQKIYDANKNRIKDPKVIHPGQKIIIP